MNATPNKLVLFFILLTISGIALAHQAMKCALELRKSPCWKEYQVDVTLIKANILKEQKHYTMKVGKSSLSDTLPCDPMEQITFSARFSPPIWAEEIGKHYPAQKIWNIPEKLQKGAEKWLLKLCFPGDFVGVPIPIKDAQNCECE